VNFKEFLVSLKGQRDPHVITQAIDSEIKQASVQIFSLWHKIVDVVCQDSRRTMLELKHKHDQRLYQKSSSLMIANSQVQETSRVSYFLGGPNSPTKIQKSLSMVSRKRKNETFRALAVKLPIEDLDPKVKAHYEPICVEEKYFKESPQAVPEV